MSRRFSAKRTTITKDLVRVMNKMEATSLRIREQNILDPDDSVAEITFDRSGVRYVSRCGTYDYFLDNLRAAQLAIEYTWRIVEGYGVEWMEENTLDEMLQKVFGWLEAPLDPGILMLGDGSENWWDILGVEQGANKAAIVNAFKALSKVHHPDVGGEKEDFIKLQNAYREGIDE